MFGKIREIIRAGRSGADAVEILARTYNIPPDITTEEISSMVQCGFADTYNGHELAMYYLSEFLERIKINNEKVRAIVSEMLRRAKIENQKGLIKDDCLINNLFNVAERKFGIYQN